MATLHEIYELRQNSTLFNKVAAALSIKAYNIMQEASPSQDRLDYAENSLVDPRANTQKLLWYLLAENESASTDAITGASDDTIQTAVNKAVDILHP